MSKRSKGRPKKAVHEDLKAWIRAVGLRFEIDGRTDIDDPVLPGAAERIEQIAAREHRSVSAIRDRTYRPNRKKKTG